MFYTPIKIDDRPHLEMKLIEIDEDGYLCFLKQPEIIPIIPPSYPAWYWVQNFLMFFFSKPPQGISEHNQFLSDQLVLWFQTYYSSFPFNKVIVEQKEKDVIFFFQHPNNPAKSIAVKIKNQSLARKEESYVSI
jgi:hypothetical protein